MVDIVKSFGNPIIVELPKSNWQDLTLKQQMAALRKAIRLQKKYEQKGKKK
jgi:hypothetical protein